MKIDSSTIGMESARNYTSTRTTFRRYVVKEYQDGQDLNSFQNSLSANADAKDAAGQDKQEEKDTATQGLYTLRDWQNSLSVTSGRRIGFASRPLGASMDEFRQLTFRYIFELLFGKNAERYKGIGEEYSETNEVGAESESGTFTSGSATDLIQNMQPRKANFKILQLTEFDYQYEREATSFSTVGCVRTADGREINFNVDIGMSREFTQTFATELQTSFKMCDPLVINLDTDVASVSDQKFYFDIDADGVEDEISGLGSGSGYLALDKNGDGVINDGSELFGTKNGDGFADLAQYDEDGNGWIDENDEIFSKLKIWCKDENGNDVLYRLADKGVGAICLQRVSTDFTLQRPDNQVGGAIRSTGVFLYENGNVGTVQHVDVAKYEQGA